MGFSLYLITLSAVIVGALGLPSPAAAPIAVPDFTFEGTSLRNITRSGKAPNFNQNYVASGANVQYSPSESAGTFTVKFNTKSDFVVGLGWQPGDTTPITYSGSFSGSGVALLSVYGWSENPLVEYYIMETSTGYQKVGTHKGSVTSDGGTYDIWEHQQVNQPSIKGTQTFQQYISIRSSSRSSGTVTLQNHFDAWSQAGMKLGSLNYQVVAVESWSGSGQGSIQVSKGT
ncbi:glycoside hydrolase family 11 protein [Stipitochalara longipes BDJ]|nr:glycoside hydrolase family 11 protein [Stipitochalara longipes BDJ]